jgi:hypothetical protein
VSEERLQILRMVEAGKLKADEAVRLLEAVDAAAPAPRPKSVRVRVTEPDRKAHQVTVSLAMVDWLFHWVGSFEVNLHGHQLDLARLHEAIRQGKPGKIVEAEEEGRRVEVWLE